MEKTIRFVEREILDKEYARFKILHRDRNLATGHILKIAGDFWRDEGRSQRTDRLPVKIGLDVMLGGLSHCVRWITTSQQKQIRLPKATWRELDQEALDFLVWGMQYHSISVDHILWSRNMLLANVDTTTKTIKFSPFSDFDIIFFLSQQSDQQHALKVLHNTLPVQQLRQDFQHWRKHFKIVDGGFDFAEDLVRQLESYPKVINWLEASVLPSVEPDQDLGGYSLDEFRRFFAALFLNFKFLTLVEDGFDDIFGAEHDFGTTMLTLPKSAMMRYLQHMSDIKVESVEAIITALTFDVSNFHASLLNQPFVETSNKHLFILPRLIALANPGRLLVGAMNKGVGRQMYDKLIETLSRAMLSEISSAFRNLGLEVWQETKITSDTGKFITPDLIVLDRSRGELLVADYKHSISPIGPAEVVNRLAELKKGLNQVRGYLSAMQRPANWPIQAKPLQINKVAALLIFGYPMAIPIHTDPKISVVNRISLYEQLTQQHFTTLSDLVRWARIRPELPFQRGMLKERELEFRVSDWTYKRSIYVTK